MLRRVMGSARIKEHPRLTVSTESGMLHYELQPQSQLLFLAITLADLPQVRHAPPPFASRAT